MTDTARDVDDALFARVREHYDEEQIADRPARPRLGIGGVGDMARKSYADADTLGPV